MKMLKTKLKKLDKRFLFAGAFVIIGFLTIALSRAASPTVHFEAENSTLTTNVTVGSDAVASSGSYAQFNAQVQTGSCLPDGSSKPGPDPGSADPWGTCWPGSQNTGYPHGVAGDTRIPVTLTNYTGPTTISNCGVVIDSKTVNGDLTITAGNGTHSESSPCVIIKNSLIKGWIHTDDINNGPVVITDTEVAVQGGAYWASIGFYNTYTRRVNSHGGHMTIKCQGYCSSYDDWAHGGYLEENWHYNSFGGNGIEAANAFFIIEHGYADCGGFEAKSTNVGSDAGCSADIGFYGDFSPIRNITINKTLFAPAVITAQYGSGTQPGYCYNPGYYPGKPYPDPSNVTFTNNVFVKGPTGKCGEYGASNTWLNGNGNIWSGNKWDDGTTYNAP